MNILYAGRRLLCFSFLLTVLSVAGCGPSLTTQRTTHSSTPAPSMKRQATPVSATPAAQGYPTRLIIPAIAVNADVERVGVTSNGDLEVPQQSPWLDVGWYTSGPRPGDKGSAVIDGHLDRPGGSPAVFWYLRNLRVGDEVLVVNTQGRQLRFRVTGIASYAPQEAPIQQIFANNSGIYLNLITCAGDWIPSLHQTTQRLVVYTSLE